jgi:hypothetical protein
MAYENHWLPGFNFMSKNGSRATATRRWRSAARSPWPAPRSRLRGEARWPVHDPQPDARGEAAPAGRGDLCRGDLDSVLVRHPVAVARRHGYDKKLSVNT